MLMQALARVSEQNGGARASRWLGSVRLGGSQRALPRVLVEVGTFTEAPDRRSKLASS
jgi:hypothetical protein